MRAVCEGCKRQAQVLTSRWRAAEYLGVWCETCWPPERSETSGSDPEGPNGSAVDPSATALLERSQISDGEVRVTAPSGGQKGRKPARFGLIPGEALWRVAELYGKGAEKYEDRNWERGYDWSLSFDALMRHAWQFWNGEDCDAETGQPHMASVTFHALALLTFMEKHREYDDRPNSRLI